MTASTQAPFGVFRVPEVKPQRTRFSWRRLTWVLRPLGIYAVSRLMLFFVMTVAVVIPRSYGRPVVPPPGWPDVPASGWLPFRIAARWDGAWYQSIALHGYGDLHAPAADSAREAFFPAYPLLIRAFRTATGLPVSAVAPLLTLLLGGVAAVFVWILGRRLYGEAVADRAAALFSFAPASFVLSMAYSEGLLLACVTVALVALDARRWGVAGVAAAAATATHSNAVGLLLACAVAAVIALRERREWRALLAVGLAPLGLVAWFAWLWAGSGTPLRWFDVEHDAWYSSRLHLSAPFQVVAAAFRHPSGVTVLGTITLDAPVAVFGAVGMLVGLVLVIRQGLPAPFVAYTGYVAVTTLFSIGARPRMVLVAVPICLALAAQARGRWFSAVLGASALALSTLAMLSWAALSATP